VSAVLLADALAKGGEAAKAGPIGLVVILVLCIACYFLFKSMSKHLRRVREDFPSDAPPPAAASRTDDPAEPEPAQPDGP
jgi:hypothetical protein